LSSVELSDHTPSAQLGDAESEHAAAGTSSSMQLASPTEPFARSL